MPLYRQDEPLNLVRLEYAEPVQQFVLLDFFGVQRLVNGRLGWLDLLACHMNSLHVDQRWPVPERDGSFVFILVRSEVWSVRLSQKSLTYQHIVKT